MKTILNIALLLIIISCNKKPEDYLEYNIKKGEIKIAADESLRLMAEAQIAAYEAHYPKAKIELLLVPEQEAISLMIKDSVKVAIVSRELNQEEVDYFEKYGIKYQPAYVGYDAITFAVNKDYPKDEITIEELKALFNNKSQGTKLVFDNSNSSNLNFMIKALGIEELNKTNIFGAQGTLDALNYVSKSKNAIAMLGFNWFSDTDDPKSVKRREAIKILKVKRDDNSQAMSPIALNDQNIEYPFLKPVIMHTTQMEWGVAKGFIRSSASQIGQLVIEKMGLVPYYNIPKTVIMENKPLN